MGDWVKEYPANIVPGGDTVREVLEKHRDELTNVYNYLNRVRKLDYGPTPPVDPVHGHLWVDTSLGFPQFKKWDSTQNKWVSQYGLDASLGSIVSLIGSTEVTLTIADEVQVNEDVTIPENVTLKFIRPGKLIVNAKTQVTGESVGTGDGVTTTFTLADPPILENSETIYVDGVAQTKGTDYTIDYKTGQITFTTAPVSGAVITADYTPLYVLTVNGGIEAGLWQIFDGDGVVTGSPKIEAVYPEWFGAKGDGVTDDTVAIQKTFRFFNRIKGAKNKIYYLANQSKAISSPITIYNANAVSWLILDNNYVVEDIRFKIKNDNANPNNPSLLYAQGKSGIKIRNVYIEADSALDGRYLYTGIPVVLDNCNNCTIEMVYARGTRYGVILFNSKNCTIFNCVHENDSNTVITDGHTCSFASYSGESNSIIECTSYYGASDGNIGLFGAGRDNKVIGCMVYNFDKSDLNTTVVSRLGAQGIFVDSGQQAALIESNLVKGFYYGIDVKTSIEECNVVNNTVYTNKVGIAVRLGEGNNKVITTSITNNTIIFYPYNRDSTTLYTTISGSGLTYEGAGIYVQNPVGCIKIEGNTFIVARAGANTNNIGVLVTNSEVYSGVDEIGDVLISNNNFNFVASLGTFAKNEAPAIAVTSTDQLQIDVNIMSNAIKYAGNIYTAGSEFSAIEVNNINSCSIKANKITSVFNFFFPLNIQSCSKLEIDENMFSRPTRGVAKITNADYLKVNSNRMSGSVEYIPHFDLDTISYGLFVGNISENTATNNGRFITGISTDYILATGNIIRMTDGGSVPISIDGANLIDVNNIWINT